MKIDATQIQTIRFAKGPPKAVANEAFSHLVQRSSLEKMESTSSVRRTLPLGVVSITEGKKPSSQKTLKRGHKILSHLSSLQKNLLGEDISAESLQDMLLEVQSQDQYGDDEKLQGIMEEIELRLSVEIAKLQRRLPQESL